MSIHKARYGSVEMLRGHCPDCGRISLIQDGKFLCCDAPVAASTAKVKAVKQMIALPRRRKLPPTSVLNRRLEAQGHQCFYCGQPFGTPYWSRNKLCFTRVEWDHMVPFIYSHNNQLENFVACCQVCNHSKGSKMFDTLTEVRRYVARKWAKLEYECPSPEEMQTLSELFSAEQALAGLLLDQLPREALAPLETAFTSHADGTSKIAPESSESFYSGEATPAG